MCNESIFLILSVRRMQFGIFNCTVNPEQLSASPSKTPNRPASPLAATPTVAGSEVAENVVEKVAYREYALLCLTNLGDCLVLSIPDLKRQLNAAAIRREDIK